MNLEFRNFAAEDVGKIVPSSGNKDADQLIIETARLNAIAGPGYTALLNGKPVGCGGVRIYGIGDAWALFSPEVLAHRVMFLRQSKEWLEKMIREHHLWKIYCELESEINWSILHGDKMSDEEKSEAKRLQENYVKFLGFSESIKSFIRA